MGKRLTDKQLFKKKGEVLQERYGKPIPPLEFYRDVFPEESLEARGNYEDRKPNMIVTSGYKKSKEEIERIEAKEKQEEAEYKEKRKAGERVDRPRRHKRRWAKNTIVFDDFDGLKELLNEDNELLEFVIIPPVAFSGKNRSLKNAYHLWGFTIDLDGVELDQLDDLIHQIDNEVIPIPAYIANSGHGMHLYYLFEDPVPMYPRLQKQLQELKKALTDVVWNVYTSTIPVEKRQYQSIVQGYRAVGSPSKLGKRYRVTAYRVGVKRTLRYLMEWAETERGIDFDEFKHVTLDEAKKLWPEWYQKNIIEGRKREPFYFPKGVYDSWKKRMEQGAFDGNRYNCIAILFSLAIRCQVEFDDVLSDAMEMVPRLNRLTKKASNEFTTDDVLDASSFYDEAFFYLGLKKVYRMTKIHIEPTKRNGNKQEWHLEDARDKKIKMKQRGIPFKNPEGRPIGSGTAEQKVKAYRETHPDARKIDCINETGLSKPTVYKWWNGAPEVLEPQKETKKRRTKPAEVFEPINNKEEFNLEMKHELLEMLLKMSDDERAAFFKMVNKVELKDE